MIDICPISETVSPLESGEAGNIYESQLKFLRDWELLLKKESAQLTTPSFKVQTIWEIIEFSENVRRGEISAWFCLWYLD